METFDKIAIICLTIISAFSIIGISVYHINDRVLMAKNIESAIVKGIDPISVRCSYADKDDLVCVAFTSKPSEFVIQSPVTKK